MTDTEMLNLIENYSWSVCPQVGGGWVIEMNQPVGFDDAEEIELARTRSGLRVAVRAAIKKQAELALT